MQWEFRKHLKINAVYIRHFYFYVSDVNLYTILNMKIFLSYRFTGEDPIILEQTLSQIKNALEHVGHQVFCSFWEEQRFRDGNFSNKQILEYALKELDSSDVYFAFVKSAEKSEGMLLEAGYALANKKPMWVAVKKGVKTTFLTELADKRIEFETLDDLSQKLSK